MIILILIILIFIILIVIILIVIILIFMILIVTPSAADYGEGDGNKRPRTTITGSKLCTATHWNVLICNVLQCTLLY